MAGGVHVRELKYLWRTDGLQKFERSLLSCSCGGTVLCCGCVQQEQAAVGGHEGQVALPFLCQHLLCQYKQTGRAFIVINRDLALILFDLKLCGCFPRDGLYLSWG